MHNIKRNKRIKDYLQFQLNRLGLPNSLDLFFEEHIITELGTQDTFLIASQVAKELGADIFDNDAVFIETLKVIGLMEASENKEDFKKLVKKRDKIKDDKKEFTDFDKILKAMMKVPNDKKGKATDE